jgi:hypothetical protein
MYKKLKNYCCNLKVLAMFACQVSSIVSVMKALDAFLLSNQKNSDVAGFKEVEQFHHGIEHKSLGWMIV